jgi:hypothetical protein
MKTFHKTLLTAAALICSVGVFAQDNNEAGTLVKQGVTINDAGKFE